MELENYITNNSILIVPNNLKIKVIKYLNSLDKMYNIKIMTLDELKKSLLFNYDTKTINYIMQKNSIDYSNALELINNMYYLFEDTYVNKKIDHLNNLKKELLNNNLLTTDIYFINSLKNKIIYIYGFDYINKYYLKLIDILKSYTKVEIIPKKNYNYNHPIYNFEHLIYSIEYIANDILEKKLDLNHVYLYGINNDNESTVKRIFSNYHINLDLNSTTTLYETNVAYQLLQDLDNYQEILENIKDSDIKDLIINILNKYYWASNFNDIKNMLEYEFKTTHLKSNKYTNAIKCINTIFDDYFNDDDYIYILNFNGDYIPTTYKDIDFINDNEKFDFLETTPIKQTIEKEKWQLAIKNIKNLTIISNNQNLKGPLKVSPLINDLNLEVKNLDYKFTLFSNKSNLYNLGLLLDNYQKYNIINHNLSNLLATYPNNNYSSYKNNYTKIKFKKEFNYNLSYSKMNSFYECSFKFYCDNILKINKYEETFDTWTGSLCHYILSKIYDNNFNYEEVKDEFILNHPFILTNENKFFLNKILNELQTAINYIKSLQNITKYQTIETEKQIETIISNIKFIGIIDKIMHYNDNIVLIDYKTGTPDIDLKLANFGLNLQLPTYLFLIKKLYPDSHIVGIYLQHILKPNFNKDLNLSEQEQYEKSLKLIGYSLGNETFLQDFDPTYENSEYINGLKVTSNGFGTYSKVLTEENFNQIEKLTEEKINECITSINNAEFNINPKYIQTKNISCEYCPYKSICYKTEKDNIYLTINEDDDFKGGEE